MPPPLTPVLDQEFLHRNSSTLAAVCLRRRPIPIPYLRGYAMVQPNRAFNLIPCRIAHSALGGEGEAATSVTGVSRR